MDDERHEHGLEESHSRHAELRLSWCEVLVVQGKCRSHEIPRLVMGVQGTQTVMKILILLLLAVVSISSAQRHNRNVIVTPAGGGGPIDTVQTGGNSLAGVDAFDVTTRTNVTSGNQIFFYVAAYVVTSTDTFVVGDFSKTGTATLGTAVLVGGRHTAGGGNEFDTAIWTAAITGSGTLTMTAAHTPSSNMSGLAGYAEVENLAGTFDGEGEAAGTGSPVVTGTFSTTAAAFISGVMCYDVWSASTVTPEADYTTIFEEEDGTTLVVGSIVFRISTGSLSNESISWTVSGTGGSTAWPTVGA